MRELKLKYFIELASNIGAKARTEAQAVEQAQRAMQGAVDKTGTSLRALDAAYARFGTNSSTERQIGYMRRLAQGVDQVTTKMRTLGALAAKGLQNAPAAVAGVAAGLYAAKTALDKPMDYDMKLRAVTATAFAGQGIDALRDGRGQVNDLVMNAVRQAKGSTREKALLAYEKLVGTGSFSKQESDDLLPMIMKTSVASTSEPTDLVQAAEKMKVTFGLKPAEIQTALSKLMRGGQEGGFEIKDSAKWIGPLAPYFKGYKGMAGIESMVTMLQQVRSTAGTNDEAANNLRNFVQKIGADSTRKDFAKQGIDLPAEMAQGVVRGETPIDTYMAQLEKVMAKQDPEGKARAAMRTADKSLSAEERQQKYEQIAEIYKTSGISKIINDLQEMGGYSGLAGTKEYGKKVLKSVREENGNAVKTGYEFMREGTGAKATALGNEKDNAVTNAFEGKAGVLNKLLDAASNLAQEFPALATAATGATVALTALGGAMGIFALLARRSAGGLPLPGVPGLPGGAKLPSAAPTMTSQMAFNAAAAAPAVMSAGAVAGTMAAGLAVVGVPILGAGYLLSEQANSRDGLRGRIADRSARIGELDTIMAGGGSPAAMERMLAEKQRLVQDRDTMTDKQNALGGGGNGTRGGYNDPRLLTQTQPSIAEQAAAWTQPGRAENQRGKGFNDPRLLTLTAPSIAEQTAAWSQPAKVELGEGKLAIDVRVTDDRASASTRLVAPMSSIKVSAGATNPAGVTP